MIKDLPRLTFEFEDGFCLLTVLDTKTLLIDSFCKEIDVFIWQYKSALTKLTLEVNGVKSDESVFCHLIKKNIGYFYILVETIGDMQNEIECK